MIVTKLNPMLIGLGILFTVVWYSDDAIAFDLFAVNAVVPHTKERLCLG